MCSWSVLQSDVRSTREGVQNWNLIRTVLKEWKIVTKDLLHTSVELNSMKMISRVRSRNG